MRDPSMIASDPEISAWVAANAGAGKTYTLANRVARLLLADAEPQKILCLTFTKAAAAEMQGRLFSQLGEWSMLPDNDLRERIVAIGGDAHSDLPKARRLFAAALETPGGLKVLTLHAFCQIVLSRFPIEAGIPPAFDVLDDQSARELIGEARQRVLERAGAGEEPLATAIARLVTETSEASLSKILDAALSADRRKLDRFFAGVDDVSAAVRTAHGLEGDESTQTISENFCGALAREIERLRIIQDWLVGGGSSDIEGLDKIRNVIAARLVALGAKVEIVEPDGASAKWPVSSKRGSSSSIDSSGRRRRLRSFINAALTTIRWSHVDSRAAPAKPSIARNAARHASCTTSRAASSLPTIRRAVASMRPP